MPLPELRSDLGTYISMLLQPIQVAGPGSRSSQSLTSRQLGTVSVTSDNSKPAIRSLFDFEMDHPGFMDWFVVNSASLPVDVKSILPYSIASTYGLSAGTYSASSRGISFWSSGWKLIASSDGDESWPRGVPTVYFRVT